ncbi:MAG: hypothetical protein KF799_13805 [Bdellovibrionales bacterium]|nr:hypothetical protein [Bdellovibrionales bacterium]
MSFNLFLRGTLVMSLSLTLLSGCGLNTGENPPPVMKPSFSGNGYSCVGQIPNQVDRYFNDDLSEAQINEFMRCLQRSFVAFAQLTRGRDQNIYSPDEIRYFLEEHFFKERPISDTLLKEFMVIKQAMIGGSLDQITRQELYSTVDLFEDIRLVALRLKPHIQVLNPRLADMQKPRDLGERLAQANTALRMAIQIVVARLSQSKQTYSYASLTAFLTEFRQFIGWDKHYTGSNTHSVEDWVTMLREFKEITVSGQEAQGVRTVEWTPLLENMSRWYLAYLQYRVGVKSQPVLEGVGLQNTIYLADELFRLTEEAIISHRPSRMIPYGELTDLYQAMYNLGWVKKKLRPQGMERALRAAFTRIFGESRAATQNRTVNGLKIDTLNAMRIDFNRWADIQIKLDANYRGRPNTESVPSIQAVMPGAANLLSRAVDMADADYDEFMRIKTQKLLRPLYSEDWSLKDPFLVYLVPDRQMDFAAAGLRNEFYNLSRMNLLRSVVTLVFRGYASSGYRSDWQSVIRKPELEAFYQDFRSIGIDVGFMDARNESVGERSFIEGNLFTYASDSFHKGGDNDGQLSFVESMAFAAFLYSGSEISTRIYEDLRGKCVPATIGEGWPRDLLNQPLLPRCCVYEQLAQELDAQLVNMPALRGFLASSSQEERTSYIENVLSAVYSPKNSSPSWVEASELTTLSVILHYAESVMTRYDRNFNGILETAEIVDEATGVVPVFVGHIMNAVNDSRARAVARLNEQRKQKGLPSLEPELLSEKNARKAFLYILANKSAPNPSLWGDWFSLGWMSVSDPNLALDRRDLAQVFKVFGGLLAPPPDPDAAPQVNVPIKPQSCKR